MNLSFMRVQILYTILFGLLISCGEAGEHQKDDTFAESRDVSGSIMTQFGSQRLMSGWVLTAVEKTGRSRVVDADLGGLFTFKKLDTRQPQTLVLLSPDYVTSAVLSIPGLREKTIRQYFKLTATNLPRIVHRGSILSFAADEGISSLSDFAKDDNSDTIPDGMTSFGLVNAAGSSAFFNNSDAENADGYGLIASSKVDTDLDGLLNDSDPDIDGDGIHNMFDGDDDGDGILDVFDLDANGDLVVDSQQRLGDLYFPEGVEYITSQLESVPQDDGSSKVTLTFLTRVRPIPKPIGVQIRGSAYILNDSTIETKDANGTVIPSSWDRQLLDDGLNFDGASEDLVYARQIVLASGKMPKTNQVFFFQLIYGSAAKPFIWEFPFTFPKLSLAKITASYEKSTRNVQLVGNPFGGVTDFVWTVNVFNADAKTVYTSQAIEGASRFFQIPATVLTAGEKYKVSVVAQSLDRIPGIATYIVHSAKIDLP